MVRRLSVERRPAPTGSVRGAIASLDTVASRFELPVLLFIALTLPLEFTKLWFPVSWLDLSRVGMVAGLGILVVHGAAGTIRLGRSPLLAAIGLIVIVEFASFATTRWPAGAKEAVAVLAYAGLALFVAHVIRDAGRLRWVALAILVSAGAVALVSVAQEVGRFYLWQGDGIDVLGRRNSTFGDPNITARFFAISLTVALAVLALGRSATDRRGRSFVAGIAGILGLIALIAIGDVVTLSRVGWLLAGLAGAIWLVIGLRHRRILLGLLVFGVTFVGCLTLTPAILQRASSAVGDALVRIDVPPGSGSPLDPDRVPADIKGVTTPVDGLVERLPLDSVRRYLIRVGVAMAVDHPLTGVGVGGFGPRVETTYLDFVPLQRRSGSTILLHTDVVRIAAETGLVGVAAWLVLLGAIGLAVLRTLRNPDRVIRAAAAATGTAILVILVGSQFAGRFYSEPYLWLAIGVLMALGGLRLQPRDGDRDRETVPTGRPAA